jgi:signal transduction histidine kinase
MSLINFRPLFSRDDHFLKNKKEERGKLALFLFINFGALGAIFLSGIYYNVFRFQPWFSLGNGIVIWAIWLIASLFLYSEKKFQTVILFSNNTFFVGLFVWLIYLTAIDWTGSFFIFFLLFLFLENWLTTNFFLRNSLFLGFLALSGMISIFFFSPIFLEGNPYFLARFLFALVAIVMMTAMSTWNGLKSYNSLQRNNQMKINLEETARVLQIRIKARTKQLEEQAKFLRQENKVKTEALRERIEELERFRRLTVDRELKMIELKKEIVILKENNFLKKKDGKQ